MAETKFDYSLPEPGDRVVGHKRKPMVGGRFTPMPVRKRFKGGADTRQYEYNQDPENSYTGHVTNDTDLSDVPDDEEFAAHRQQQAEADDVGEDLDPNEWPVEEDFDPDAPDAAPGVAFNKRPTDAYIDVDAASWPDARYYGSGFRTGGRRKFYRRGRKWKRGGEINRNYNAPLDRLSQSTSRPDYWGYAKKGFNFAREHKVVSKFLNHFPKTKRWGELAEKFGFGVRRRRRASYKRRR